LTSCGPEVTRVSVIIPTFNRADLIVDTVESVLEQTWPNVEVVVVDDGSTDDTRMVLGPYLDRVHYLHQANSGRSSARNAGVAASSGEYLVFLDSDDLLLPNGLELQALFLDLNPSIDIVYANGFTLDECGRLGPLEPFVIPTPPLDRLAIYARLIKMNLFALHAGMVRRTVLPPDEVFDESIHALEDRDLWTRLMIAGATLQYQDEKVIVYRRHAGNTRLDLKTEMRSRVAIARKVITCNLDSSLPLHARQAFRLEYLYAVVASRSPGLIGAAVRDILLPNNRPSLYGFVALPLRFITMAWRLRSLLAKRAAPRLLRIVPRLPLRSVNASWGTDRWRRLARAVTNRL
jgi:glycosyltransferase involved in cell wall biosynthesis